MINDEFCVNLLFDHSIYQPMRTHMGYSQSYPWNQKSFIVSDRQLFNFKDHIDVKFVDWCDSQKCMPKMARKIEKSVKLRAKFLNLKRS